MSIQTASAEVEMAVWKFDGNSCYKDKYNSILIRKTENELWTDADAVDRRTILFTAIIGNIVQICVLFFVFRLFSFSCWKCKYVIMDPILLLPCALCNYIDVCAVLSWTQLCAKRHEKNGMHMCGLEGRWFGKWREDRTKISTTCWSFEWVFILNCLQEVCSWRYDYDSWDKKRRQNCRWVLFLFSSLFNRFLLIYFDSIVGWVSFLFF